MKTKKLQGKLFTVAFLTLLIIGMFIGVFKLPATVKADTYGSFGYPTVGGTPWASNVYANKELYVVSQTITVTSISVYTDGAGNIQGGIYSGNTQLVFGEVTVSGAGWAHVDIADTLLTAGTYGLALKVKDSPTPNFYYDATLSNSYYGVGTGDLPATWVEEGTNTRQFSIYANYTISEAIEPEAPIDPTADFLVYQNSGTNYVWNASSSENVYDSADVEATFETAFGYLTNGQKLVVQPATYTSTTSHVDMTSKTNVTVAFEDGAILTIADSLNVTVLELVSCVNCTLVDAYIDGNGDAQTTAWLTDGIIMWNCDGCLIDNATITNCYRGGLEIGNEFAVDQPSGIINSTITFCGWNGMWLGTGDVYTIGAYAINNEVAHCSDVGITSYGFGNVITGNYIHDMDGTTGGGGNAGWGIGAESAGYNLIANNTIVNVKTGICLSPSVEATIPVQSNLVTNNIITNCNDSGICAIDTGFDTITQNQITNWGIDPTYEGYAFGIMLYYGTNYIVSGNVLISDSEEEAQSILCHTISNSSVFNNTITTLTTASSYGVYTETGVNSTIIKWNNIQAAYGVRIVGATCNDNTLVDNILANCTTETTDTGTGTRINPSSSATFTLTINNPYYNATVGYIIGASNPTEGRYIYSNTTTTTITLTPASGYYSVLNVDGINVTLTDNQYDLSMGSDHVAYAMFPLLTGEETFTLSLTVTAPTATTYPSATVPVQLSSSGNDTNPVITWNAKFTNSTWLYVSNQTYSGTTSMTINENATDVLFCAHVIGDNLAEDYEEVEFTVEIIISESTAWIVIVTIGAAFATVGAIGAGVGYSRYVKRSGQFTHEPTVGSYTRKWRRQARLALARL